MENLPELHEIFKGEVASVTEYGAFIKIPGCRRQGLVHKSHMSSSHVDRPTEVVDVGEKVWVKVIGRETKDGKEKVSLSMKVVNQGNGKDLDPNNIVLEQDERKRREFKDYSKQKITLEAVLNTVCQKCGCKGHFAKDCFMQPGGTKYTLLPEEEDEHPQEDTSSAKKKKKEKEKKRKKHHREKQDSESDSSESSSSDSSGSGPSRKKRKNEEKSRKTSKKKKRKNKKHKHKNSGKGE